MRLFTKCWKGAPQINNGRILFLNDFISNLEKEFVAFYRNRLNDNDEEELIPPFWYSERVTNTFATIALSNIPGMRGNILQEYPVNRKKGDDTQNGRIDYLCYWGNEFAALELKQAFIGYDRTTDKLRPQLLPRLHREALDQLDKLNSADEESWADWSVALSIAPVFLTDSSVGTPLSEEDFVAIMHHLEGLFPDMNDNQCLFIAGFTLPRKLAEIRIETDHRTESYPAVFVVGTMEGLR